MDKILTVALIVLTSCSRSEDVRFTLTGSDASFVNGKYMYVLSYAGGTETLIDSALIRNSAFEIKGTCDYPTLAFLYMGRDAHGEQISDSYFVVEQGAIRVEKRNGAFVFTGTPQNDRTVELTKEVSLLWQSGRQQSLDSLYRAVALENRNVLAIALLSNLLRTRPGTEIGQLTDSLPKPLQQHPGVLELRARIAAMRTDTGRPYLDIAGRTPDGDSISLSKVVLKPTNRYVLLDFGALWCGPCREEYPNIAALRERYCDKGFEVFGVSFDANRKRWLECIETFGMCWPQISQGFGVSPRRTRAWQDYSLSGIPSCFLIDCSTGMIVAKNLRGKALAEKISQLLD